MRIREGIEILEAKLEGIERGKVLMLFVLTLLLVGYLFYLLLLDPAMEELRDLDAQRTQLQGKLLKNSPKRLEHKILGLKKELLTLRSERERLKERKLLLLSKLSKERYRLLGPESLSSFLDSLLAASVKKRILLHSVTLSDEDEPFLGLLRSKKSLDINGSAPFLDLVSFVRSIEDQKLLLRIDSLHIETNGSVPAFDLHIKLYGAKL